MAVPPIFHPEICQLGLNRTNVCVSVCSGASSDSSGSSKDSGTATVNIQLDSNTVDVRGKATDEALAQVEAGLDSIAQSALFIVHGVGTGKLRSEVHQFLQDNAQVARFSLEKDSGGGCTVVHLK